MHKKNLFVFLRTNLVSAYSDRLACGNIRDPDQTPRSAASDLGLKCSPLSSFRNTKTGTRLVQILGQVW